MTKRIRNFVFTVLAGAGLAVVLAGANPSTAAGRAFDGKSLYSAKCASCHGMDGSGNTAAGKKLKVRDLGAAEVQKDSDAKLLEIISKGKNKMPAFSSKLSADEIKQVVGHVRNLKR